MHKSRELAVGLLLSIVFLCGCYSQPHPDHNPPTVLSTSSAELLTTTTSFTKSTNILPILFIDKTNFLDQAYVLCSFNDGVQYSVDDYQYNGKDLSSYQFNTVSNVHSSIFVPSPCVFVDNSGRLHDVKGKQIICSGEGRIIDEIVEVRVELEKNIGECRWLLGTYSQIDIFPKAISFEGQKIVVDLDLDGDLETVHWTFIPAELYGKEYYYYDLQITKENQQYNLAVERSTPVKSDEFAVFIADVNLDTQFEVIFYRKYTGRFGVVDIYQYDGENYTSIFQYALDSAP